MTLYRFLLSLLLFAVFCVTPANAYTVTHTVKPGETLESLSQAFGVNKARIMYTNNFKYETDLRAGQTILIPNPPVTAEASPHSIGPYAASQNVRLSPAFDHVSQDLSDIHPKTPKDGTLAFESNAQSKEAGIKAAITTPSGAQVTGVFGFGSDALTPKNRAWQSSSNGSGPVGGVGLQIPF
ncbi:LysM peptidoglycan-binding domain-containing protein [Desulfovibrio inopinatus]|uniref:LysM peptidoglycan-binding domain-containing protein n=1 Tax=Desulfovibrio inopinatus TaxID=102109 RepID=UPI0004212D36|nr:LysM peptidoglycan-binding domain-containing protein [Desulfovibrio inopinatus]